ncbi:MAG: DUF1559 domain-containing protein, partial [Planctomycetales bacterium]|nr:DUF1559 domain-containing protein [Planctomycetales bacterium]
VVIAIIGVLVSLLLPAVQAAREAARRTSCINNLRNVALAVNVYHDGRGEYPLVTSFPDARVFDPLTDSRLYKNWAIDVLPHLEQQNLFDQFVVGVPKPRLTDPENAVAIATELSVFLCPSDTGAGRPFVGGTGNATWARGNYGLNAFQYWPTLNVIQAISGQGDDHPINQYIDFNMGMGNIGGPAMSARRIADGTTHTIMLAEMRTGLTPSDRRGVWAMGMCGSNFHCRHASNFNNGVNSCGGGEDDLFGGDDVIDELGAETLRSECMMPAPGVNRSGQSTVRSLHPGGAHVAMLDGSVHFISDFINAGNIGAAAYIGQAHPEDILPENFGVWQRLNMSADGMVVPNAF